MLVPALIAGIMSGAVLLFLSHIAPAFGAGNFIRDVDEPRVFGRLISHREGHLLGILLHLALSGVFGGLYAYLVELHIFTSFGLLSLLGWSVIMSLFIGGVVLPLEGHGIFGVKEDAWFPVDLFLTNVIWSMLFWVLIGLWPASIFFSF